MVNPAQQVVVRLYQSTEKIVNKAGQKIWNPNKVNQLPVDRAGHTVSAPMDKITAVRRFGKPHKTPDSKGKIVVFNKVEIVPNQKNLDGTPRYVESLPPVPRTMPKTGFWTGTDVTSKPGVRLYGPGVVNPKDGKMYLRGDDIQKLLNPAEETARRNRLAAEAKASEKVANIGKTDKPTGADFNPDPNDPSYVGTLFGIGGAVGVGGAGMGIGLNNNKKKGKRNYDGLPF